MSDDRDFIGYGADPPDPKWPGEARIAVNINLNFEGGGERSVMDGDGVSEGVLNDIGFPSLAGGRSPMVESVFEYGSRVGVPRILALLRRYALPATFCIPAITAERHPYVVEEIVEAGHYIALHGYTHRRPDALSADEEEEEMGRSVEILERVTGQKMRGYSSPAGEYSPRMYRHSGMNSIQPSGRRSEQQALSGRQLGV